MNPILRLITDHKLNRLNDAINISAVDAPGPGGANHRYLVELFPDVTIYAAKKLTIEFQNGPIARPEDMNGFSVEALLAIAIDRIRGFQGENPKPARFGATVGDAAAQVAAVGVQDQWGKFRCRENALALTHLQEAMHWLQHRTRERLARGVEGTLQR